MGRPRSASSTRRDSDVAVWNATGDCRSFNWCDMTTPRHDRYRAYLAEIEPVMFSRNRAQILRISLDHLTDDERIEIGCTFVAHALDTSMNITLLAKQVIKSVRESHAGNITIKQLHEVCEQMGEAETIDTLFADNHESCTLTLRGSLLRLLVLASCQRELEDAQLLHRNRYQPSVAEVAEEARRFILRQVFQESAPQSTRSPADVVSAKQLSNDELEWQLAQVVAVINGEPI